jgi:hypothetical protein
MPDNSLSPHSFTKPDNKKSHCRWCGLLRIFRIERKRLRLQFPGDDRI